MLGPNVEKLFKRLSHAIHWHDDTRIPKAEARALFVHYYLGWVLPGMPKPGDALELRERHGNPFHGNVRFHLPTPDECRAAIARSTGIVREWPLSYKTLEELRGEIVNAGTVLAEEYYGAKTCLQSPTTG